MSIQHSHTERIARPVGHVFDVVVRHQAENHPRWETECLEVRPLTDGPLGVGSRQVMVRREYGRTREVENTCTEYEDGRRITWSHPDRQMDFVISFDFVAVDDDRSDVTATVTMTPKGVWKVMGPLMRAQLPKRSARISSSMREVVEAHPAYA